jgi:AcrR family transcriptional regulator
MADRGLDATSMDAIADSSGVSKATIYKHWPDKEALMLEIMADMHGIHSRPKFDSGDIRSDLVAVLAYRPEANAETRERIMPHFMAYSAGHPAFGQAWRNMVMDPPRRELRHLLEKGMGGGELSGEIDIELALAVLIGPIMYWFVFLRQPDGQPGPLAEYVVDGFWRAWSTKSRPAKR